MDGEVLALEPGRLDDLFAALHTLGYVVVGPTIRDGAIVYDRIAGVRDLPAGWTDEQEAGQYRLRRRDDGALFGYAVGPHAWKRFLFPPRTRLFSADRRDGTMAITPEPLPDERFAFLGVRACELAAIAIQDQVFTGGPTVDPAYKSRRERAFVIAVECAVAGGTCFCVSMGTGPAVKSGFDLAITELIGQGRHVLAVRVGSPRGAQVMSGLTARSATRSERETARETVARTAASMGRMMKTDGLPELLAGALEHPQWEDVAQRCLTCANCTMVCPTCFCSTVEDTSDLSGDHAERWRRWDSCFTMDFSSLHGGVVRHSPASRYRQWMTHKLSTWWNQFGQSGCVGCGRCITWCPAGIDITQEVRAIASSTGRPPGRTIAASTVAASPAPATARWTSRGGSMDQGESP